MSAQPALAFSPLFFRSSSPPPAAPRPSLRVVEGGVAAPAECRYLFVDLNSYFASCEQQVNPALRGRPVAVVPAATDFTCAIAASYEAKSYGIRTGTLIYEAKQRCPDLVCVPARHKLYTEFHDRILRAAETVLPVDKVHSIDEFSCRLLDNECTPQRAMQLARELKAAIARDVGEHLKCSIGLAPNRFLAKLATDLQKPDGLVMLSPADLPGRVAGLRLGELPGIGYNMQRRLLDAGIGNVRQLWDCSAEDLRRIWGGVMGERFWHALHGRELPEIETRRRSIGHSHVLEPSFRPAARAAGVGRRLVLKAASRLRRMGFAAGTLHIGVRIEGAGRFRGEVTLPPTQDSFAFLSAFDAEWRRMIAQFPGRRVKKIGVVLSHLCAPGDAPRDLFASLTGPDRAGLWRSIDNLNARYGRDTVSLGQLPGRTADLSAKIAFTRIPDAEEYWE